MSLQNGKAETTRHPRGRSRRISDDEYGQYREKIQRLYLEERISREEIIYILAEEDEFLLSPKQLKHILQKWGVRKNIKSSKREDIQRQSRHQNMQVLIEPASYRSFEATTGTNESVLQRPKIHAPPPDFNVPVLDNQWQHVSYNHKDICAQEISFAPTMIDNSQTMLGDYSCLGTANVSQGLSSQMFGTQVLDTEPRALINSTTSDSRSQVSYSTAFTSHAGAMGALIPSDATTTQSPLHSVSCSASRPGLPAKSLGKGRVLGGRPCSYRGPSSSLSIEGATSSWPNIFQRSQRPWQPGNNAADRSSALGHGYSAEVNPAGIVRLILNLNSVCTEFLDHRHQWQLPWGYSNLQSSQLARLCHMLTSGWYQVAMNQLLHHYLHASAHLMRQNNAVTMTQDIESTCFAPCSMMQAPGSPDNALNKLNRVSHKWLRWPGIAARESEESDTIIFHREILPIRHGKAGDNASSHRIRITHLPRTRTRALGISLTLQSSFDNRHHSGLCTGLRTFNVIPEDSDVVVCIKQNDLAGLQQLLSLGRASLFDVCPDGYSLLWYAIAGQHLEIFRLLLDVGASVEDVYRGGDIFSVMAVFLGLYHLIGTKRREAMVSMIKLACARYNNVLPSMEHAMLSISMLDAIKTTEDARVLTDIVGCLKNAFDLEYRIDCGQTQLLFTSFLTNSFALRVLIANGANTQATDDYGRGALHSALYPHSFIVLPNSCDISEFPCDTFHQCTCPSGPQAHDRHYQLFISESLQMDVSRLEPTLLVLLNAQCDPNIRDDYGLTPSDYARRNAGIWEIWHTALQETGYAYDEESGECYKTYLEFI